MSQPKDLVGQTFGRLVVVSRADNYASGKTRFECRCSCGKLATVGGRNLLRGATKSCGCWRVEMPAARFRKHGMRRSAEYRIWCHVKTRCLNPKSRFYHRYGGRGIRICATWRDSFEAFFRDMGRRPSPLYSIERKDNDGHYSPNNCVWAVASVQGRNRSTVRFVEFDGRRDSIAGWARRTGIPYLKLRRRLVDGWPVARALEAKDAAVRAALFQEA